MQVVIRANPDCGASRNVLALIEAAGYKPTVIEYLKTGWTRPQLEGLLGATVAHPALVNRPSVCTPRGVGLCRPRDAVLDLLDRLPPGPFRKEDGQLLIDSEGRRVG
jgi:arsenate reductase